MKDWGGGKSRRPFPILKYKKMSVQRFTFTVSIGLEYNRRVISNAAMLANEQGEYVRYDDYKHLSDYCDHLVQFSKMPCLPKDLEVLRDANASLATQNKSLLDENAAMSDKIKQLETDLQETIRQRDHWFYKWRKISITLQKVRELLNNLRQ